MPFVITPRRIPHRDLKLSTQPELALNFSSRMSRSCATSLALARINESLNIVPSWLISRSLAISLLSIPGNFEGLLLKRIYFVTVSTKAVGPCKYNYLCFATRWMSASGTFIHFSLCLRILLTVLRSTENLFASFSCFQSGCSKCSMHIRLRSAIEQSHLPEFWSGFFRQQWLSERWKKMIFLTRIR